MKEPNPDLYYNRATIFEYLERYNEAVRDYYKAHSIDQSLQADKKAEKIVQFVVNAATLISNKGRMKSKKLTAIAKSVPSSLHGSVKFSVTEEEMEKKNKINYSVVDLAQL